eukprot:jgi/Botrbrau1/502/Bobra.110_2s0132.1
MEAMCPLPELPPPVVVAADEEAATRMQSVNLPAFQADLSFPEFLMEVSIFQRLLYKNKFQHRGSGHYKHLWEVARLLKLFGELRLPEVIGQLDKQCGAPKTSFARRGLSFVPTRQARVPSREAGLKLLVRLQGGGRLLQGLVPAIRKAAPLLGAQLEKGFFVPFCLTAFAILARLQVLAANLLLEVLRIYNEMLPVVACLPASQPGKLSVPPETASMLENHAGGTDGGTAEGTVHMLEELLPCWRTMLGELMEELLKELFTCWRNCFNVPAPPLPENSR